MGLFERGQDWARLALSRVRLQIPPDGPLSRDEIIGVARHLFAFDDGPLRQVGRTQLQPVQRVAIIGEMPIGIGDDLTRPPITLVLDRS